MKRVCVFCGSTRQVGRQYLTAAWALGAALADRGIGLVYGGGRVGLMGAVADAALGCGGEVIGVIPRSLWEREIGHTGLSELRVVTTMHERKALMSELADAFIALPGGLGTLEELFEVWTWAQLGVHHKPCALLNVNGYYTPLLEFLQEAVTEGFVRPAHREMLIVEEFHDPLLERLAQYEPPVVPEWIAPEQT